MIRRTCLLVAATASLSNLASAQLMVVEATNDRVLLFDEFDGNLLNANFLDLTTSMGTQPVTPTEALQAPNGEIWVSDQATGLISRFSPDGTTWLGQSTAPLSNIRGFEIAYGSVWVSNFGGNNGAPGPALVQLDLNLNLVANHLGVGALFDVQAFTRNGVAGLLLGEWNNQDLIFFDPSNPSSPTIFHDSDGVAGINYPMQVQRRLANGNAIAVNLIHPVGIYEYDANTGNQVAFVSTAAQGVPTLRGVHELGNGNYLFTSDSGIHRWNTALGTVTTLVSGVDGRYISKLAGSPITSFCDPANANSTGLPASITGYTGTGVGSGLHLSATGGPNGQFGYFLIGTAAETSNPLMLSQGWLCMSISGGNGFGRYNVPGQFNSVGKFNGSGVLENLTGTSTTGFGFDVPLAIPMSGTPSITAGSTWHFQLWYRDSLAGVGLSNLSNGLSVGF